MVRLHIYEEVFTRDLPYVRTCTVIPGPHLLRSRGNTPVWCERHRVETGDGGEALVHCLMLPGARRRGENLRCGGGNK